MEDVVVRSARPDDAAGIARAHVHAWQSAYRGLIDQTLLDSLDVEQRTQGWRRILEEAEGAEEPGVASNAVLVCTAGETVAGWAAYGPGRDEGMTHLGELTAIYVHPGFWGAGIGHALLERVERRLVAAGWQQAYLWVLDGNKRAIRFYTAHGWAADGRRKTQELREGVIVEERCYLRHLSAVPPERRVIRLFPDYGRDWPLWENSTPTWDVGYTTDPQMYGLSARLTEQMREWNDLFEAHFHWERGWETGGHRERWQQQGERIAQWLREEVRSFADVSYEPWPLKS